MPSLARPLALLLAIAALATSACAYLSWQPTSPTPEPNPTSEPSPAPAPAPAPAPPDATPTKPNPPPAPAAPASTRHPRLFYWSGTTDENELRWRSKVDWAQKTDFGAAPVRRDISIFYGQFLGNYPRFGLHQAQKPGYMDEHLAKVRRDVETRIAPDFTGLICIDYENWNVLWERLVNTPNPGAGPDADDADLKDDWRDHLKAVTAGWSRLKPEQQEELCRATYNKAARDFFLKTLAACKSVRPKAKWGFYDYPSSFYGGPEVASGEISYPENGTGPACERNDQLRWLFDAVDVLFPVVYCLAYSVPDGEKPDWQKGTNSIADTRRYMLGTVREAVRVAKGKPVVAYAWLRYLHPKTPHDNQFLNEVNLRQTFELPFEAGADGIAIWESFNKAADFPPEQEYIRAKVVPVITEVAKSGR